MNFILLFKTVNKIILWIYMFAYYEFTCFNMNA